MSIFHKNAAIKVFWFWTEFAFGFIQKIDPILGIYTVFRYWIVALATILFISIHHNIVIIIQICNTISINRIIASFVSHRCRSFEPVIHRTLKFIYDDFIDFNCSNFRNSSRAGCRVEKLYVKEDCRRAINRANLKRNCVIFSNSIMFIIPWYCWRRSHWIDTINIQCLTRKMLGRRIYLLLVIEAAGRNIP